MSKILYFFVVMFLLFSCGTQKNAMQNISLEDETSLIISYNQTSGQDNSPEYSIELFSNRQMYLTASKNLDKQGKYMRVLPEKEFNQIIDAFVSSKFFSFKDEYTSDTTDLPTRFIYFSHDGKEKKIRDYYDAPQEIKELELLMQSFLDRVGWEKMSW